MHTLINVTTCFRRKLLPTFHGSHKKTNFNYQNIYNSLFQGPVGVGYTCYCAPFFRHMEARLDKDKQELKEHIDQAHQRLDQKVSNLERRTQGQLSELTRCVVAERALCDQRHLHLAQWITRGAVGRSSERVRGTELPDSMEPSPVRARSVEHLLDHQTEWRDQQDMSGENASGVKKGLRNGHDHRSLEMLVEDDGIASWRRHYRNSSHEISCREQNEQANQSGKTHEATKPMGQTLHTYAHELAHRLKQGLQKSHKLPKPKQDHNKSFETLLDKDIVSWRGQPHRRSANELPAPCTNSDSTNNPESPSIRDKHNRSFDTLLDHRSWRDQPHYRSVNELPTSHHQRSQESINRQGLCHSQGRNHSSDVHVKEGITSWTDKTQQRNAEIHTAKREDSAISQTTSSWKEKLQQESKETEEQRPNDTQEENKSPDWAGQPIRRSVHEMVAQFQSAQQTSQIVPNWKIQNKTKSAVTEVPKFPEVKHNEPQDLPRFEERRDNAWRSQNLCRGNPIWQADGLVVCGASHYRCNDDNGSSESSEGEDGDATAILRIPETGNPDYENVVAPCPWQAEESRLMSGLPYRSRSAVYSPTHEPADLHNDSGYSTKLYGSSKGPSPSLSGINICHLLN